MKINFSTLFALLFFTSFFLNSCEPPDDEPLGFSESTLELENFYIRSLTIEGGGRILNEEPQSNDMNLIYSVCEDNLPPGDFASFRIVIAVPQHPNPNDFEVDFDIPDSPGLIVKYGDITTNNIAVSHTITYINDEDDEDGVGRVALYGFSGFIPDSNASKENFEFIKGSFQFSYRDLNNSSNFYIDTRSFTITKDEGC